MKVLVLNAGSSSQKSCLYDLPHTQLPQEPPQPLWEAQIDWPHGGDGAKLKIKTVHHRHEKTLQGGSRSEDSARMLETLYSGETRVIADPSEIEMVGHRVVHGGEAYRESTRITPEVKAAIDQLARFAPVHNPANLAGIEALEALLGPQVPQIAVFDTAFHSRLPAAAYVYPGPYEWLDQGIRRYGFHGISHRYCAERAAQILGRDLAQLRLITCHLGNGCSLAAVQGGFSIDTTMGFTPLEGLMMGSRSGSVDPGILIHLMRQADYTVDKLDHILNQASGLEGVSGISNDLRPLFKAIDEGNARAKLALDIYIHRLRAGIGAMAVSLGGLDALIFTAGVGENAAPVRAGACEALGFLGVALDPQKNNGRPRDADIAAADSAVRVLVIHTQEDWAIARECWQHLRR
ncbi:acetate kinase [Gloeobacter violaceus]|uniref:Acetate kinase n=1 Tax=Gloeobacter violaceus (strain ATCC 29082 / PCC 7421) TaxID=251221 RepID=ACKA_GLOVI|nr:acetate kinase [Gloeobacter violaceus]Q7NLW9.1 RecName: Full=Acetate kinase; AltName: Full=Acetokinase [Gloeobacter violaceus PCC 7421]BAC88941.1 acetate kinase [Gloeobacter violaceus PCC 7421]